MHHPTFGLHYPDSSMLKNDYLAKLRSNNYDVYFNGHEHLLNHAAIPLGEVEEQPNVFENMWDEQSPGCLEDLELFPNATDSIKETIDANSTLRTLDSQKGEYLHQFTLGASGQETYQLCQENLGATMGRFNYASNAHNGFGLATVFEDEFRIEI